VDNDQTKSRFVVAIHFYLDTTIGTDINGCLASSFTLTSVVANQIAAEWQEDTLHGGYMIMQRARL
jgi:hypothetical protein